MVTQEILLPKPLLEGSVSVEEAIRRRRSVRRYKQAPLALSDVSQLLWAAQGLTHPMGYRTSPSAGALYPLEVYLVSGEVVGLKAGVYRYLPASHILEPVVEKDMRETLSAAALRQSAVRKAPAAVIFCAVYERATSKYGRRGIPYAHMEAGHAAQNVSLQAVALNLGTVMIGAFEDELVRETIAAPKAERPLYIVPVGRI